MTTYTYPYSQILFSDTETVGLTGDCMLLQYSQGLNDKIHFLKPHKYEDQTKLKFFETLLDDPNTIFCAYNAGFDLFHLYKLFNRGENPFKCKVLDLQIHAKLNHPLGKFSYKREGSRAIASLKYIDTRVATQIGEYIQTLIQSKIPPLVKCKYHIHKTNRPNFVNITFTTTVPLKLKTLMQFYGEKVQKIEDVWPIPERGQEKTHDPLGSQPWQPELFSKCLDILENPHNPKHHNFWKYAADDIKYLKILFKELNYPKPTYNDTMAHIVAYTYYRGFDLDKPELLKMKKDCEELLIPAKEQLPFDVQSPKQKIDYFSKKYPDLELTNADQETLSRIAHEKKDPEAKLASEYGSIKQKYDQCLKLLDSSTGRGHPNFNVIGTATQRLGGSGNFNWQGIGKYSPSRKAILTNSGGDFSGLEINLAAIIYEDKQMLQDLVDGICIHTIVAVTKHPKLKGKFTYEEAVKIRNDKNHKDFNKIENARNQIKGVVFGSMYGAMPEKISVLLNIPLELARQLVESFFERYSDTKNFKDSIEELFVTGDTEEWKANSVSKMKTSITDKLGFTRSWKFEAEIANLFWTLAMTQPPEFQAIFWNVQDVKVIRREEKGPQTVQKSVYSALLGAALTIQKSVARTAINSIVQSVGAQITKRLCERIWYTHYVPMLNIHDEVIVARHKNADAKKINQTVQTFIKEWRHMFPTLAMKFGPINNWSER